MERRRCNLSVFVYLSLGFLSFSLDGSSRLLFPVGLPLAFWFSGMDCVSIGVVREVSIELFLEGLVDRSLSSLETKRRVSGY